MSGAPARLLAVDAGLPGVTVGRGFHVQVGDNGS